LFPLKGKQHLNSSFTYFKKNKQKNPKNPDYNRKAQQTSPSLSTVLGTQERKLAAQSITNNFAKTGAHLLCLKAW